MSAGRRGRERQAWQDLRALVLERNDRRREACEALGMSFVRVKALRHVATSPVPMRELAAALGTDASYTTVVVDDLERRGLVVRETDAADRRAKTVHITAQGRAAARTAERVLATPPTSMRGLSDSELDQLQNLVSRLLG